MTRLVEAFTQSILDNRDPNPSGVDGFRCVQITDAILRSAREGVLVSVGA